MTKKRILYFLDFSKVYGGASNTAIKQAALMKNLGYDVLVTIPINKMYDISREFEERCQKLDLNYTFQEYIVSTTPEDIDVVSLLENYKIIRNYIFDYNPDIVHSVQINPCVEMACRELGIPNIMNIYPVKERFFSIEYPDVFPHYHICDSKYFIDKWKKFINLDSVCIRNTCEIPDVIEKEHSGILFVCIGTLSDYKNQLGVIQAIQKLYLENHEKIQLHLLGYNENAYGRTCIEYVNHNHMEAYVFFKGFVASADCEIAKYDALVCGSRLESFPNVISEAMAAKVPVISTPVGGVPEILRDFENAYICSGYSVESIYEGMRHFVRERNSLEHVQLIQKAFETYEKEFSPKAVSRKLAAYYEHVVADFRNQKIIPLQIEWFRDSYKELAILFKRNEELFHRPDAMQRMVWLIPFIKARLQDNANQDLVIWGAGLFGADAKVFADIFFKELSMQYFIDKTKSGEYLGYPVVRPRSEYWKNKIVWIANTAGQNEIYDQLTKCGKIYNKDFFIVGARSW